MTTFLKVMIAVVAIAAGSAGAQADPVIDDLARTGAIVTTHGILGPR